MTPAKKTSDMPSELILLGVAVLLSAQLDLAADGDPTKRSEFVLSEAGFSHAEIAKLVGRNAEAVRSSLRRAAKRSAATPQR